MNPIPKKLLDRVHDTIHLEKYSNKTEGAYLNWIIQYILFHDKKHPQCMSASEVVAFLTYLAVEWEVAASTQIRLSVPYCSFTVKYYNTVKTSFQFVGANRSKRVPVVLTKTGAQQIFVCLSGNIKLIYQLHYGSGLRVNEAVRLREKDVDLEQHEIIVRDGKGAQDRVSILSESILEQLKSHLVNVEDICQQDFRNGNGRMYLPYALARNYPNAEREWIWQYVFPAKILSRSKADGIICRHHISPATVQKAVRCQ